jgi:RNA polymerase sigma-70 factor (ECF subfamily)
MMQVKNGDLDKLGLLFERYHLQLYGFFYRLTSRRDISEDLVQGVFERILKYRSSYTGEGEFATWIFRIARNHHADYYRSSMADPIEDANNPDWELQPALGSDASIETEEDVNRWLIQHALDKLDSDKKKVLVLSRYEGFRYREIAEIMECSESAVKVRVFRALNEMKETITKLRKQEKL